MEKAKIGLIQFCISPPKTDVSDINCSEKVTMLCQIHKLESELRWGGGGIVITLAFHQCGQDSNPSYLG